MGKFVDRKKLNTTMAIGLAIMFTFGALGIASFVTGVYNIQNPPFSRAADPKNYYGSYVWEDSFEHCVIKIDSSKVSFTKDPYSESAPWDHSYSYVYAAAADIQKKLRSGGEGNYNGLVCWTDQTHQDAYVVYIVDSNTIFYGGQTFVRTDNPDDRKKTDPKNYYGDYKNSGYTISVWGSKVRFISPDPDYDYAPWGNSYDYTYATAEEAQSRFKRTEHLPILVCWQDSSHKSGYILVIENSSTISLNGNKFVIEGAASSSASSSSSDSSSSAASSSSSSEASSSDSSSSSDSFSSDSSSSEEEGSSCWYIVGDGSFLSASTPTWDPTTGVNMTEQEANVWAATVYFEKDDLFKIYNTDEEKWLGDTSPHTYAGGKIATTSDGYGGYNWLVKTTGYYTITVEFDGTYYYLSMAVPA